MPREYIARLYRVNCRKCDREFFIHLADRCDHVCPDCETIHSFHELLDQLKWRRFWKNRQGRITCQTSGQEQEPRQ